MFANLGFPESLPIAVEVKLELQRRGGERFGKVC